MLDTVIPLFPGVPGGPEVLIVLFVLVLLFGANKIPKLARSTGQAMGEFQKGRQEIEEELEEMQEGPTVDDGSTTETDTTGTDTTETETTGTDTTETETTGTDTTETDTTGTDTTDENAEREQTN